MSSAAQRLAESNRERVQGILDGRYKDAQIVRDPQWLNEDVLEALFTVPYSAPSTRRAEKVAWICRSGTVQIFDGWDVP